MNLSQITNGACTMAYRNLLVVIAAGLMSACASTSDDLYVGEVATETAVTDKAVSQTTVIDEAVTDVIESGTTLIDEVVTDEPRVKQP